MAYINVTKDTFARQVLEAEKTVILDFWAPWCGPCRMVAPILEEIADERQDVILAKVNVDDEPELAVRYGVAVIPTILVLRNGLELERIQGYRPKETILELLP